MCPGLVDHYILAIMGNESANGGSGKISNPYKRETLRGIDGQTYDTYFYYTEKIGVKDIESGLTPVVFLDGKVAGIGWTFAESVLGASSLIIKRR
jgi:hypothetical protein